MRTPRGTALAVMATSLLFGCNQPSGVGPPAQEQILPDPQPADRPWIPTPTPAPSPPPPVPADWPKLLGQGGSYSEDFSAARNTWGDWKDAKKDDGYTQSWLGSGTWYVASAYRAPLPQPTSAMTVSAAIAPAANERAIEFNDMRPQPYLCFRRYAGKAFGTDNGELPANYTMSLDVTPLESREDFYPPVGDLGVPVFYLDPQHYVELLIKPDHFQVWECNGGIPLGWRGWRQLYEEVASISVGVPYSMGATVNSNDGTMQVYFNGRMRREVKSPIIKPYTHYAALRAGSNHVQFTNIQIQGQ